MELEFIGKQVDLTMTDDGLLAWPTEWTAELRDYGFIDAAVSILAALPKCALRAPWIIGSASKALGGAERLESASHKDHRAFDMSPMFDKEHILSPDGAIMGLAWNVISVDILSCAYAAYPHFVVEGDHLHVQPGATLPADAMLCAMTMPRWYEWTGAIMDSSETVDLAGSFWVWVPEKASFSLAPNEVANVYLKALMNG